MTHSEFQKSSFVKAECNETYVQLVRKNVENKVRGPVKGIDKNIRTKVQSRYFSKFPRHL